MPEVAGTIVGVKVKEGDIIKKDDMILSFGKTPIYPMGILCSPERSLFQTLSIYLP